MTEFTIGNVSVSYCPLHIGHDFDVEYHRLSQQCGDDIITKAMLGIPSSRIVEDRRNECENQSRDDLLNNKDIQDVTETRILERLMIFKTSQLIIFHFQNVENLVDKFNHSQESKPIIFYKSQHEIYEYLDEDRMILVMQSEFQRNKLLEFGSKAVCIDTTYNLTDHDFKLVTIAILDGHNETILVAWLITDSFAFFFFFFFFKNS